MTAGDGAGRTAGGRWYGSSRAVLGVFSFRHACATEVREREAIPSRHPSSAIRAQKKARPQTPGCPRMDAR